MARPIVTRDHRIVVMRVCKRAEMAPVFKETNCAEPSFWSLPITRAIDGQVDHIHVAFSRLEIPAEHAGMLAIWMGATYGDTNPPLHVLIDTVEDLSLVLADEGLRRDDRELFQYLLDNGLKQALFSDSPSSA